MNNIFSVVQLIVIVVFGVSMTQIMGLSYEETIEEMLNQCSNSFQHSTPATASKNRLVHECEKNDPDGDYKYSIAAALKTRYSKREFLCTFFSKAEDFNVDLLILLSHTNFTVHSVSLNQFFRLCANSSRQQRSEFILNNFSMDLEC